MTVPATYPVEPPRPLLRRTFSRALLGGMCAFAVVIAVVLVASLWPGAGATAERLLTTTQTLGVVGTIAQAVLVATVFAVPIVLVLEHKDRQRMSLELTFVAVLAGTLTTAFSGRSIEDGAS